MRNGAGATGNAARVVAISSNMPGDDDNADYDDDDDEDSSDDEDEDDADDDCDNYRVDDDSDGDHSGGNNEDEDVDDNDCAPPASAAVTAASAISIGAIADEQPASIQNRHIVPPRSTAPIFHVPIDIEWPPWLAGKPHSTEHQLFLRNGVDPRTGQPFWRVIAQHYPINTIFAYDTGVLIAHPPPNWPEVSYGYIGLARRKRRSSAEIAVIAASVRNAMIPGTRASARIGERRELTAITQPPIPVLHNYRRKVASVRRVPGVAAAAVTAAAVAEATAAATAATAAAATAKCRTVQRRAGVAASAVRTLLTGASDLLPSGSAARALLPTRMSPSPGVTKSALASDGAGGVEAAYYLDDNGDGDCLGDNDARNDYDYGNGEDVDADSGAMPSPRQDAVHMRLAVAVRAPTARAAHTMFGTAKKRRTGDARTNVEVVRKSTQEDVINSWELQRKSLAGSFTMRLGNAADISAAKHGANVCPACEECDSRRVQCIECVTTRCAACDRVHHAHEYSLLHRRSCSPHGSVLQPGQFVNPGTGAVYVDGLDWDIRPHYDCVGCGHFQWVATFTPPSNLPSASGTTVMRRGQRGYSARGFVDLIPPVDVRCGHCNGGLHDEYGRFSTVRKLLFSLIDLTQWWPISAKKPSMVLHVQHLLSMLALQHERPSIGFEGIQAVQDRLTQFLVNDSWGASGEVGTVARRQSVQRAFTEFRFLHYERARLQGRELTRCVRCSPAGDKGSVMTASLDGNAKIHRYATAQGAPEKKRYPTDVFVSSDVASAHTRCFPAPVEIKEAKAMRWATENKSKIRVRLTEQQRSVLAAALRDKAGQGGTCPNIKAGRVSHNKRNVLLDEHGCSGVSCRCGIILALVRQYRHENKSHMSCLCSHVLMPLRTTHLCTDSGCQWWDKFAESNADAVRDILRARADAVTAEGTARELREAVEGVAVVELHNKGIEEQKWDKTVVDYVEKRFSAALAAHECALAAAVKTSAKYAAAPTPAAPVIDLPQAELTCGHRFAISLAQDATDRTQQAPVEQCSEQGEAGPSSEPPDTSVYPVPRLCSCVATNYHLFAAPLDPADPSRIIEFRINNRISMLHGLVHVPQCRWWYMALFTERVGWWHGEELEHAWSRLSPVGRLVRGCGPATYADILSDAVHSQNGYKNKSAHTIALGQMKAALKRARQTSANVNAKLGGTFPPRWATNVELAAVESTSAADPRAQRRMLAATGLAMLRAGRTDAPGEYTLVDSDDALLLDLHYARSARDKVVVDIAAHDALRPLDPGVQKAIRLSSGNPNHSAGIPSQVDDEATLAAALAALAVAEANVFALPHVAARDNDACLAIIHAVEELRTAVLAHAYLQGQQAFIRAEATEVGDSNTSRKVIRGRGVQHIDNKLDVYAKRIRALLPQCGPLFTGIVLPAKDKYDDDDLAALEAAVWPTVRSKVGAAAAAQHRAQFVTLSAKCDRAREEIAIVADGLIAILSHHLTRREEMAARIRELQADAEIIISLRSHRMRGISLGAQRLSCDDAVPAAASPTSNVFPFRVSPPPPWAVMADVAPRYRPVSVTEALTKYGWRAALRLLRGLAHDAQVGYRASTIDADDTRVAIISAHELLITADVDTADAADASTVADTLCRRAMALLAAGTGWAHAWPCAADVITSNREVDYKLLAEYQSLLDTIKAALVTPAHQMNHAPDDDVLLMNEGHAAAAESCTIQVTYGASDADHVSDRVQ